MDAETTESVAFYMFMKTLILLAPGMNLNLFFMSRMEIQY
jgi:hypothetical protein